MSDFEFAVKYVLDNEGGYSNDPNDPGGATNFGITAGDLARWRKKPVTASDVQNMSVVEAENIYRSFYWDPLSCDGVNSKAISTAIFDTGVLYGISTSGKYAQRVCASLAQPVKIDGVIGPMSLKALNSVDDSKFIHGMYDLIIDHIDALVDANNRLKKFQAGWVNRAKRLLTLLS